MSNIFTSEKDITLLKKAGSLSAKILFELQQNVLENITAGDINDLAEELCAKNKVVPSFKGVPGPKNDYNYALCVSVNDEVLHAIPYKSKILKAGDIVKLDFGIKYEGFFTDHCVTVAIGKVSKDEERLINTARLCVDRAILEAVHGNKVGDISNVLQTVADLANLKYIKSYCGHGIGRTLHEPPEIPAFGQKGTGITLKTGMVLCVENQLTLGTNQLKLDSDGWTLRTVDGSKSAMFEHMVYVQKNKPFILTDLF